MVMHARKIPRVNDGLFDRSQARSYENTDKYPSKGPNYNERYTDVSRESPMYNRHRDESPNDRGQRYQNKSSYIERSKEKFDRASNSVSADKRVNHHPSNDGNHSNRNASDRHGNSHTGTNKDSRDHKADLHLSALRISGDWSEHISSSGKKYYYNIKTEKSQWEKPKEWVDLSTTKSIEKRNQEKDFRMLDRQARGHEERKQHSSVSDVRIDSSKPSASFSNKFVDKKISGHPPHIDKHKPPQHRHSSASSSMGAEGYPCYPNKVKLPSRTWHGPDVGPVDSRRDGSAMVQGYSMDAMERYARTSSFPYSTTSDGNSSGYSQNGAGMTKTPRNENEDSQQAEDMDISPGSTPTTSPRPARSLARGGAIPISMSGSSRVSTSRGMKSSSSHSHASKTSGLTPKKTSASAKTLPQLISQLGDKALRKIDSQELTQQAIQTLQQLQHLTSALSRQAQNAAAASSSQSPRSDMTSPYPQLRSPQVNNSHPPSSVARQHSKSSSSHKSHRNDRETPSHRDRDERERDDGRESPHSEISHRSSGRGSPTPSQSSSQGLPVTTSSLAAAAATKPPSIQLTPSLVNYCNDRLITHVLGWHADQVERQANRYSDEAHTVGSLHCTRVSTELKKARSLVRVSEIQATLQEQRVLFLRQQIKELENLKSQNTFMPSQDKTH